MTGQAKVSSQAMTATSSVPRGWIPPFPTLPRAIT
jgi:hypothetical protein